jgi:type IV secretory pathway TrbD component
VQNNADHPATKTGVGAVIGGAAGGVAGGAAAGALAGGMTGPVGAAVGAVVGAVAGAVAGHNAKVDPVAEDTYWRDNYSSRPYINDGAKYDDYQPAYRYGADSYTKYPNRTFDEVEPELSRDWGSARGQSSLEWENAKHATRDAWQRVSNAAERAIPGDSDGDGR